jgi:V8-like Glu-specific endopeptidase
MDVRRLLADRELMQEFLDRAPDLADRVQADTGGFERSGGLESLEGGQFMDQAAATAEGIAEGTYVPGTDPGLEAIIERFTRPVYLVQRSTFAAPGDTFPNSEVVHGQLEGGRTGLERVIPSAGRIDLRNHQLTWVGTGWVVAPDIVVTNRHVAREFASDLNGGFAFRKNHGAPAVAASVDWRHEYQQDDESRFRVREILWIEPEDSVDVALLRIAGQGEDGEASPAAIELMTRAEFDGAEFGAWVAVIGYPAQDSRNSAADQQRIFDGIYNVKRLAPGQVTAVVADDILHHDATTLGGNSGSVVVHLASGKAMGLHFGGIEADRNAAVQAPRVHQLLQQFLS